MSNYNKDYKTIKRKLDISRNLLELKCPKYKNSNIFTHNNDYSDNQNHDNHYHNDNSDIEYLNTPQSSYTNYITNNTNNIIKNITNIENSTDFNIYDRTFEYPTTSNDIIVNSNMPSDNERIHDLESESECSNYLSDSLSESSNTSFESLSSTNNNDYTQNDLINSILNNNDSISDDDFISQLKFISIKYAVSHNYMTELLKLLTKKGINCLPSTAKTFF